jgi:hypothetical protein
VATVAGAVASDLTTPGQRRPRRGGGEILGILLTGVHPKKGSARHKDRRGQKERL